MREIVKDKSRLLEPCKAVTLDEGLEVAEELHRVLEKTSGIGLAANQIGIDAAVFVISLPGGKSGHVKASFVNPKIVSLEDPIYFEGEGCLSFPGETLRTLRYNNLVMQDDTFPSGRAMEGLTAVVCQHEYGHLVGKTMHDYHYKKIGPNVRCPCGSGKKFKKCCMPLIGA